MSALYYIEQTQYGCDDGLTLRIRWNDARIIVHIDRNPSPTAAENHLIDSYTSACMRDDDEEEEKIQDELLDIIVRIGESLLDGIAPPSTKPVTSLHSILFPPQFSFNLVTVDEELMLLEEGSFSLELSDSPEKGYKNLIPTSPVSSSPTIQSSSFTMHLKRDNRLPQYSTTDIKVVRKLLGDGYISHVSVDGHDMCAKVGREFDGGAMQREFNCLSKICYCAAQQYLQINIPKLLGLIKTPENGSIIGILEQLIPYSTNAELSSLDDIGDVSAIPHERREAWATQIRWTVDWLHENGVVWGDAKAGNIIIHPDTDQPWLIDFGGGNTPGWVDEDLAGTSEGDDQGVRRILEFLQLA